MKATNIILQGLSTDIYSLLNHHKVAKDLWERVQLVMQGTYLSKQERECKMYNAFDKFTHIKEETLHKYYLRFTQLINDMNIYNMKMEQFQVNTKFLTVFHQNGVRDDLTTCLNKAMAFLIAVASSRFPSTNNQLRTSSNLRNQATIQDDRVTVQQVHRRQGQSYSSTSYESKATSSGETMQVDRQGLLNAITVKEAGKILDDEQLAFLTDLEVPDGQAVQIIIPNNVPFQTEDLDTYDSDCDDISNAKAVLMANISNYGFDVILE
nr:hypothetical protein [Tanacetum cinerariifolium]